ncbi:MAG: WYL domain-containing protein [Bryobacterales bacterium]|nr:WYL domain-containing protein [Bryobacterales bacterium]
MMMDILRHGAAVEVLSPTSLRKLIADEARTISSRYV